MEYEICYLIGEAKEANLDKIRKDVEKILTKRKATLVEGEFVKKRRLSYEIKKEARGTYVAKRFTLPNKDEREEKYPGKDFIGEMTKDLNFNQDLLRFIIIKTDELPSLEESEKIEKEAKENRELRDNRDGNNRTPKRETLKKDEKIVVKVPKKEEVKESVSVEEKKIEKISTKKESKKEKEDKKKSIQSSDEKIKNGDDISEDNIDKKLDEILDI